MAGGRPTKYKTEMCDKVIELGKKGASRFEMCLELDIHHSTLLDWEANKPEFSEALKNAELYSHGWWSKYGRLGIFGQTDGFNATGYIFNMKNRFSKYWKDKQEVETTGTTTQVIVKKDEDKESVDELDNAE